MLSFKESSSSSISAVFWELSDRCVRKLSSWGRGILLSLEEAPFRIPGFIRSVYVVGWHCFDLAARQKSEGKGVFGGRWRCILSRIVASGVLLFGFPLAQPFLFGVLGCGDEGGMDLETRTSFILMSFFWILTSTDKLWGYGRWASWSRVRKPLVVRNKESTIIELIVVPPRTCYLNRQVGKAYVVDWIWRVPSRNDSGLSVAWCLTDDMMSRDHERDDYDLTGDIGAAITFLKREGQLNQFWHQRSMQGLDIRENSKDKLHKCLQ